MRIVGIEENVNRPSATEPMAWVPDALRAKLLPSVEQRIADMDAAGIAVQVLSAPITTPGPDGAANPIGHLGEGLAFHLHRIDTQLNPLAGLPKPIIQYLTENIWYTTSGYFFDDQFALTRAMFGDDRVVFSVDYPFEDNRQAREWFNRLDLPSAVRERMAHRTADQLLRLPASGT